MSSFLVLRRFTEIFFQRYRETLMIVQALQSLLKPTLPEIHTTRFRAVMAAVKAGLSGAKVAISALGRASAGLWHRKYKIKRMDRLIGNPYLSPHSSG